MASTQDMKKIDSMIDAVSSSSPKRNQTKTAEHCCLYLQFMSSNSRKTERDKMELKNDWGCCLFVFSLHLYSNTCNEKVLYFMWNLEYYSQCTGGCTVVQQLVLPLFLIQHHPKCNVFAQSMILAFPLKTPAYQWNGNNEIVFQKNSRPETVFKSCSFHVNGWSKLNNTFSSRLLCNKLCRHWKKKAVI